MLAVIRHLKNLEHIMLKYFILFYLNIYDSYLQVYLIVYVEFFVVGGS